MKPRSSQSDLPLCQIREHCIKVGNSNRRLLISCFSGNMRMLDLVKFFVRKLCRPIVKIRLKSVGGRATLPTAFQSTGVVGMWEAKEAQKNTRGPWIRWLRLLSTPHLLLPDSARLNEGSPFDHDACPVRSVPSVEGSLEVNLLSCLHFL